MDPKTTPIDKIRAFGRAYSEGTKKHKGVAFLNWNVIKKSGKHAPTWLKCETCKKILTRDTLFCRVTTSTDETMGTTNIEVHWKFICVKCEQILFQ
jgi:hypothetical protein